MKIISACIAMAALLAATAALAQDWPAKPIRVIIPFAAGSVSEAIFRVMTPAVEAKLGQRFIVESKPGADGNIGTSEVVRSAPDGYTLLLAPTANFAVVPWLYKDLNYDPLTQLDPISLLADAPLIAVVGAQVPSRTLKEFADYARASPGKYNFGSPGTGSPAHLAGVAFSQMTGDSLVYIPYKGTAPMVQALLAGDIQAAFPTLTGVISNVRAGKIRILAVLARQRMAEIPDVPTSAEAGFPQLTGGNWWVLATPRGASPRIIERLYTEFRTVLGDADVRKRISDLGHVAIGLSPTETAVFLRSESARYRNIVEVGKIKLE
jgi:tripartite-type tricarboxylate transporter receptor subunit TctC